MTRTRPLLPAILTAAALALGCAGTTAPASPPASAVTSVAPTPVPEVRPGVLAPYLPPAESPDSLALLQPPPAEGSAAMAADLEVYRSTRALRDSPRWELAALDADLSFPSAAGTFSCALGVEISEQATPRLYTLLRRSLADGGIATGKAKNHYARRRPFVLLHEPSCTPGDEERLSHDGSYPSGHTSIGWTWALLLAEIDPDRDDAILARGHAYGQSRVVCGVHWQSDVVAGREIAAAVVARLHTDATFRSDLEAAKAEVAAARAAATTPNRDCADESAALDAGPR